MQHELIKIDDGCAQQLGEGIYVENKWAVLAERRVKRKVKITSFVQMRRKIWLLISNLRFCSIILA